MNKIIIYNDKIGRTLIGEIANETETTVTIRNPSVMQIMQHPVTKEISMQLLPLILYELLDIENTKSYSIVYNKNDIDILRNGENENEYLSPAQKFIDIRKTIFDKLADGSLLEIAKKASASNASTPEIIEVK